MTSGTEADVPAAAGTVLVVDDEPDVRQIARMMLRRAGYTVLEATNGQQAVAEIARRVGAVDAVLLDVTMPVMTGHEALPAMRAHDPSLPVVFFSGYDRTEVAEHIDQPAAYTAFLAKPFGRAELVARIEEAVASRP